MLLRLLRRKLAADKSGAAAIEFAFVAIGLVLFTLAIVDVGFALFWFNRAEKATQLGVRVAAVSDPVAGALINFRGTGSPGASCRDGTGAMIPGCVHPDFRCSVTGTTGTCTNTGLFSSAAFSKIFGEMRTLYPQLSSENVEVEYRPTPLGFVGRPSRLVNPVDPDFNSYNLVPQITVRIVNLTYNWVALGSLLGLAPLNLPVISASLNAEDLDHTTNL